MFRETEFKSIQNEQNYISSAYVLSAIGDFPANSSQSKQLTIRFHFKCVINLSTNPYAYPNKAINFNIYFISINHFEVIGYSAIVEAVPIQALFLHKI